MLTSWLRGILVGAIVLVATSAHAQRFEMVLSGMYASLDCRLPSPFFFALEWTDPDRFDEDVVDHIASADGRRVLGIKEDTSIVVITSDGKEQPFFAGLPAQYAQKLAVASSGRVFAKVNNGLQTTLVVISPAGMLERTFPAPDETLPKPQNDIAVGPDACTLFLTTRTGIGRMNGCTGAPLPDLIAMPDVRDFVVLADGQLLVATQTSVVLVSASGSIVRTVATLGTYGLGNKSIGQIAAWGDSLWIAVEDLCVAHTFLLQVSVTNGAEISRREVELKEVNAIIIGAVSAPIPTASEWALLTLAAALAAGGAVAVRRC